MVTNQTEIGFRSVAIETHGCKLNQADSFSLAGDFERAGFRVVSTDERADIYIVNTCTVTHVADRKARHAIRSARRRNPDATIVATGCYAEREPGALGGLDQVDMVVGNSNKASLLLNLVESKRGIASPCSVGADSGIQVSGLAKTRVMVKIQEGCDQICAYCIVPKVRGRERSIHQSEIIDTVNKYVAQGYKEVVLTGTQLGTYGFDLRDMDLSRLLRLLLNETSALRIRVSSLQPQEISKSLLNVWENTRLCPHFHLPLQSGSDVVLKRMRRRYGAKEYGDAVKLIRDLVPMASITADVIVGFPGETDDQFQETYKLCERAGFAAIHVFPYSARPSTSAYHFEDKIDNQSKSVRMQQLLSLSEGVSRKFRAEMIGSIRPVLWETAKNPSSPSVWVGLTDNYVRVQTSSNQILENQITPARLISQHKELVIAEVV